MPKRKRQPTIEELLAQEADLKQRYRAAMAAGDQTATDRLFVQYIDANERRREFQGDPSIAEDRKRSRWIDEQILKHAHYYTNVTPYKRQR
jgi:hypothetical protein